MRKLILLGTFIALFCHSALAQQFSDWGSPENLGAPVNSVNTDFQPFIAKDGLTLYFTRIESNIQGQRQDVWASKRDSVADPWGDPVRLGPAINDPLIKGNVFVTIDGHFMFFNATRPEGVGAQDIYVSHRKDKRQEVGPNSWEEPVNLGLAINSSAGEQMGCLFEDEATGTTTLFFNSNKSGTQKIYASTLMPDGTFSVAVPVEELNSSGNDSLPRVSKNGLEIYFTSDRPGSILNSSGKPSQDIWYATRASTLEPWSPPQNLGPTVNSPFADVGPSISFDGTTLYFHTAFRTGNLSSFFDVWKTTRNKLTGPDKSQ